jgi:hypothetical protein
MNVDSQEFTNRLAPQSDWKNYIENNANPRDFDWDQKTGDQYSHGTNVAGIIAAKPNNGIGYASGLWNDSFKILPIRVLDSTGQGEMINVADGIKWAVDHGAKIINLSLGTSAGADSPEVDDAFTYANQHGVVIVCAAGNETTAVDYPTRLAGSYPNVIAVGATGYTNSLAYYSCYGPEVTVVAPGGDDRVGTNSHQQAIWNITYDRKAQTEVYDIGFLGTSQATPHVTALAALLYSYGVTSPSDIKTIISQSATNLGGDGPNNQYGYGLINAFAALIRMTYNPSSYLLNLNDITVGIRDPQTKQDIRPPVHPDGNGVYHLPQIKNGNWELYAGYPPSANGYKYYRVIPINVNVNGPIVRNFSLYLVPASNN